MENESFNANDMNDQWQSEQPIKSESPFANSPYQSAHQPTAAAPQMQPKPKKHGKFWTTALTVVAAVAASAVVTALCVNAQWNARVKNFNSVVDNKLAVLQEKIDSVDVGGSAGVVAPAPEGVMTPGQVYDQNVKAVVAISNESLTTNFYGQVSRTASSGSGFIISEDGYVVTNYHVVSGATTLKVITADSQEHEAKLVGYDSSNDLAVLKIEGSDFAYTKIGSSDALFVGDQVAAIGNPLGELTSTLTVGYVSAKDRAVLTEGSYMNMLQTDAAINSGNSGGPLFNMYGEVIGITTAKYSGTSNTGATIEGIGFAIPIDDVIAMIDDLVTKGHISGAYLGVMVQDVDSAVAQMYGFPTGAYVQSVTVGSCAERAGIQAKDIITNLGGHNVANMSELTRALRKFEPGQTTTVTVYRGGSTVDLEITLDEKPKTEQTEQSQTQLPEQSQQPEQDIQPGFGGSDGWSSLFPFFGFGG